MIERLATCKDLPSPPGVASQIVEMSQDPSVGMREVAAVIEVDPALAAKLLQTANSPTYARQRSISTLTQAVTLLGLNATLSIALGLSLVSSLRTSVKGGLDYQRFWRRSLGVATFARVLARTTRAGDIEQYFLCGLLQDLGILVVDRIHPEVYVGAEQAQADHSWMMAREQRRLNCDHSQIGAWLLHEWAFPEAFQYSALYSHNPQAEPPLPAEFKRLLDHIYVAQLSGDLWWRRDWGDCLRRSARESAERLGIDRDAYIDALTTETALLQETATVFDIDLGDLSAMTQIIEQARDALELRTLQGGRELTLGSVGAGESSERDPVTGLYARTHTEYLCEVSQAAANRSGVPLSVLCLKLDDFTARSITLHVDARNEFWFQFGQKLLNDTRKTDVVGRLDDVTFVVLMPSTPLAGAEIVAERVLATVREFRLGSATENLTASAGLLEVGGATTCPTLAADDLLASALAVADRAAAEGGDRCISQLGAVVADPSLATTSDIAPQAEASAEEEDLVFVIDLAAP
ncbi:MAG: HDOD domain-containing protein [Gammaproteobacteria bacterium]|nr:HDOD domain-containing protein [Gammaproteobacteria bacterium]